MNTLFILLLSAIPFLSNAQSDYGYYEDTNTLYTVMYSELYQQPLKVEYTYPIRTTMPTYRMLPIRNTDSIWAGNGKLYGGWSVYYPDVNVTTITQKFTVPSGIRTSDDQDYENIYNKGHVVPVKYFDDEDTHKYVWSYLNCALIHPELYSGAWGLIEDYEISLSKDSNVNVSVEVVVNFLETSLETVEGGATVPTSFTKTITTSAALGIRHGKDKNTVEVYTFPNNASVKGKGIEEFKDPDLSYTFYK
jgi:hypothetical protein